MNVLTEYMPIIIDVIAVFIALAVVYKSYRMGFMRSLILLVGYVAALFAAVYLGNWLSQYVYDNFIRIKIVEAVENIIVNGANSTVASVVPFVLDMLPQIFFRSAIENAFGGEQGLITAIEDNIGGSMANVGDVIADYVVAPLMTFLMSAIICLVVFMILIVIVKVIAGMFKKLYAVPIIGSINSILGGLLGILKAPIILLIIGLVVSLLCSLTSNGIEWLNQGVIDKTIIFKHFIVLFSD